MAFDNLLRIHMFINKTGYVLCKQSADERPKEVKNYEVCEVRTILVTPMWCAMVLDYRS